MSSVEYSTWAFVIMSVYLLVLLAQRRYRLLLPSTMSVFIWTATSFLMICQLEGFLVSDKVGNHYFEHSSKFVFLMAIASVVGFSVAHFVNENLHAPKVRLQSVAYIDVILKRFVWVPYLCGFIGISLLAFLLSVGGFETFMDYRMMALTVKRVGFAAIAQRLSGHVYVFGCCYLMLLGYKYGQTGLKVKSFLKYFFLCSTINLAIGGRSWIMVSLMPFLGTFVFTRTYSKLPKAVRRKDAKALVVIVLSLMATFSAIGLLRGGEENEDSFIDKFLYLTDGAVVTNFVVDKFPEGSFEEENGLCTLFSGIIPSPMNERYGKKVAHLSLWCVVPSVMPSLYYDFGMIGGGNLLGCAVLPLRDTHASTEIS